MIVTLVAASYRAGQELGFFPRDVVLFPFLVLAAWVLSLYWIFAGNYLGRYYDKAYEKWAKEQRLMAYGLAILIGATVGGATGAGGWKLFELHRRQMEKLKESTSSSSPIAVEPIPPSVIDLIPTRPAVDFDLLPEKVCSAPL
jgi:hypothetical protein